MSLRTSYQTPLGHLTPSMFVTLTLAIALTPAIPAPNLPGFHLISSREIAKLPGGCIVAEDGKSVFIRGSRGLWESILDIETGTRLRGTFPGEILLDDRHWATFERVYIHKKSRSSAKLIDCSDSKRTVVVEIVDTMPNTIGPAWRSEWSIPGGVETLLFTPDHKLYRAVYRWKPPSVTYTAVGKLPATLLGYPSHVVSIDRSGNRAIISSSRGEALWIKGRSLQFFGLAYPRLWLGHAMRFSPGKVEEYREDGTLKTVCTGWTMLGMDSTGTLVVFRRELDGLCALARFRS